jgi:hypothetical protein
MRLFTEDSKRERITIKVEWNSDTRDVYCESFERTLHILCPAFSKCRSLLFVLFSFVCF